MTRTVAVGCAAWLAWSAAASAHRLDEYLQATQIAVSTTAVDLSIDLTPGVEVADRVIALIDADGDDALSAEEQTEYAARVLSTTALEIDGRRVPVTLLHRRFPSVAELRAGTGTMHLQAQAATTTLAGGSHELRYVNLHEPEISAYLVNALVPPAGIAITAQHRDPWQRQFTLGLSAPPETSPGARLPMPLALGGLVLAGLVAWRGGWLTIRGGRRPSARRSAR